MHFKYKSYLQSAFSAVPNGDKLNYFFQRYITKSLPRSEKKFNEKLFVTNRHIENFKEFNQLDPITKDRQYYEFGAGWDLIIPLAISHLGFEVTCVDIRRLIIPEMIKDTLCKLEKKNQTRLKKDYSKLKFTSEKSILKLLKDDFNLNYFAPLDARKTNFKADSFDFITSSNTFEHIPKEDIYLILLECYRILKKGGVFSMRIDYQDHWSYFDKSISAYNYIQFSSKEWAKYNPSLHYQNRLRHSDYLDLIARTDFTIVKDQPRHPDAADLKLLTMLNKAKEFSHYDINDLGIRGAEITLIK